MGLKSLRLENYRNYTGAEVTFSPYLNLILGENASGKTNLLEAVYCLGTGTSYRVRRSEELVRWGAEFFRLEALVSWPGQQAGPDLKLVFFCPAGGKKSFLVGENLTKVSRALEIFPVTLFCPDDLYLVKGSATFRRRYLDLILSRAFPGYLSLYTRYHQVLRQRNALLRQAGQGEVNSSLFEPWEEQLASLGSEILKYRQTALTRINTLLPVVYRDFNLPGELQLLYCPTVNSLLTSYQQQLARLRAKEARYGCTLLGPHRDELLLLLDGKEARLYASQGQQRLTAFSLRMAEFFYLWEKLTFPPVLLLDDLFSELDTRRQEATLNFIYTTNTQVLLSATSNFSLNFFPFLEGFIFEVKDGKIARV